MHLLSRGDSGGLKLTEFVGRQPPEYAILSHTWLADTEEVTFKDIKKDRGKDKKGYWKIEFCLIQAQKDGLNYCWVDTCCIDKTNSTELQEAINSMYKWYHGASKCYVYLADIHAEVAASVEAPTKQKLSDKDGSPSRWFSRGWTLQELLAPGRIEFYDTDGIHIGDKQALIHQIHNITRLPIEALNGLALSKFSLEERMSWIDRRNTKREEDLAYCLWGIFDVMMVTIYGEGRDKAFARLREEINKKQMSSIQTSFKSLEVRERTWRIPFDLANAPMSDHFVGRQEELSLLEQALPHDGRKNTVVLHGLGGVGKTQLAIRYAHESQEMYTAIFWINARDSTTLHQSAAVAMRRVIGVDPMSFDTARPTEALCKWLGLLGNNHWLMIVDNNDDPPSSNQAEIFGFPINPQGHTIVVSRSSQLRLGKQIELRELEIQEEQLEILKRFSQRDSIGEEPGTAELLLKLDGLPLGLAIAGNCLHEVSITSAEYLEQHQSSWSTLQEMSPILGEYEGRTLRSTWETSLELVRKKSPEAEKLLYLLACISNQDIWYDLVAASGLGAASWLAPVIKSKFSFGYYMRIIAEQGLVRTKENANGYEMNACVHEWLRGKHPSSDDMCGLALRCIARSIPSSRTREYWVSQRRLLPHADAWSRWRTGLKTTEINAHCLEKIGLLYRDQSRLTEASTFYNHAIDIRQQLDSPGHPALMQSITRLGAVLMEQGNLPQAEKRLVPILAAQEMTLPLDDPLILNTVKTIGTLRLKQGELAEAEVMLQRAYMEHKDKYGPDDIMTWRVLRRLGHLYEQQGKDEQSVDAFEEALKGLTRCLHGNHPYVLDTRADLGEHFRSQGELAQAERHTPQAVQLLLDSLGPDHRITLWAMVSLGNLRCDQSEYDAAKMLLEQATIGLEQVLGPDNARTLFAMKSQARLYEKQDKSDEAEKLLEQVLERSIRALGAYHLQTVTSTLSLGRIYEKQDKLLLAETKYKEAVDGFVSYQHYGTTTWRESMRDLARIYSKQHKYDKAKKVYSQLLGFQRLRLGESHAEVLQTQEELALACSNAGRNDQAISICEHILDVRDRTFGPERSDTLRVVRKLGGLYLLEDYWAKAEKMHRRAFEGYEKKLGFTDEKTLTVAHGLASVYSKQGRYDEAEELCSRVSKACERTLGQHHDLTVKVQRDMRKFRLPRTETQNSMTELQNNLNETQHEMPETKRKSFFSFSRKQK